MKCKCLLMLVMISFFNGVIADMDKDKEECIQPLIRLAPCLPYVGGDTSAPTPDCCTNLTEVIKISKRCMCMVIKYKNKSHPDYGIKVNVTLALKLLGICNAYQSPSQCPALLGLPPDSADSHFFYQMDKGAHNNTPTDAPSPANGTRTTTLEQSHGSSRCGKRWYQCEAILGGLFIILMVSYIN